MFQKPKVGIAFTEHEPLEEQVDRPQHQIWANTVERRWALRVLLLLLCNVAFIYPTIDGAFLPSDDSTVRNNPVLYGTAGLKTIWGAPQRLPQLSPFAYSALLVEHQFFIGRPRGYRIISIEIQFINALLLWLLLRRLELPGAWLAAALFAIHPVQVDAVCWISQQRYLICGFFYLCALLVYLRKAGLNPPPAPPLPGAEPLIEIGLPENETALYAISMLFFVLALLSHLLGATFPLVVGVLIWWERGKLRRTDLIPLIPFAAVSVAFAVTASLLFYHRTGELWFAAPGPLDWIVVWGRGVWTYLLLTVLPISLSFAHPVWNASSIELWQWVFPIAAIGVLVALWRMRRKWGRGPLTAALLFICLLLPSALGASDPYDADLPGVMIHEHVLYLACAAVLVPLAAYLSEEFAVSGWTARLAKVPGVVPLVALVIVLSLSLDAALHAAAYNNPTSLWENVLRGDSNSIIALNTLGKLEMDAAEYDQAEQQFRAALRADPGDPQAELNLAHLAEVQKDFVTALDRYHEVLHQHPDNVQAFFGLGEVLAEENNTKEALQQYAKVAQLDPRNALVYNNIGLIYAGLGNYDEAIAQYKKAISTDARSLEAYINLANIQFQQQKYNDAKDTLQRVLEIDPQYYVAWLNAGVMAESLGDISSAEIYFRRAIYYKFDSADAWYDLGVVLMRRGDLPGKTDRLGEAIYCFKRAAELDPSKPEYEQDRAIAQQKKDAIIAQQQQ